MGILTGTFHAKSGHPGGSLSIADLVTYLYCVKMNVDPKNPDMPDRDRLVLSKGHTAPALYATLQSAASSTMKELKASVTSARCCRATPASTSPAWI